MKASTQSYMKLSQLQQSVRSASVKSFSAHSSKIHSVAWNADGKRLASGSLDKTGRIHILYFFLFVFVFKINKTRKLFKWPFFHLKTKNDW